MFVHCAVSLRKLDIYMDVNMKISYIYITLFDLLYTTITSACEEVLLVVFNAMRVLSHAV